MEGKRQAGGREGEREGRRGQQGRERRTEKSETKRGRQMQGERGTRSERPQITPAVTGEPGMTAGAPGGQPLRPCILAPRNGPVWVCSSRIHLMKNLQLLNGICSKGLFCFLGNGSGSYLILLFWETGIYVKKCPFLFSKRKPQTLPTSDGVFLLQLATLWVDVFLMSAVIIFPLDFWITLTARKIQFLGLWIVYVLIKIYF